MASSAPVNEFNQAIKASGVWNNWMRANGIDTSRAVGLSDTQRKAFQRYLESQGAVFPDGVEIDQAGNMNENEGFGKQLKKWGPLAAGIAVSLFGIPGTPIAGLLSGGGAAAGATGAASATGGATGAATAASAAGSAGLGGTLLRYGLQYGVPVAGSLIAGKMASNAQRDSDRVMADYYDRALDAEREDRDYRRGFDEEGRRYDRYSDSYGRDSSEEQLRYGRARDDYGRLSDEERLAYDRSQAIRDKNYGYQQYGNFVETLEPFRASGSAAVSRMSGLLGGPTPPDTGSYLTLARTARDAVQSVPTVPDRPTWSYEANRPTWNYEGSAPSSGTNAPVSTTMPIGDGDTVRLEIEPGVVQDVPARYAGIMERAGARRVEG